MAEITTLARPYAKAAFEVAHQAGQLDHWADAINTAAVIAGDPRVVPLIDAPQLSDDDRQGLFAVSSAPEGFDNFLAVLIDNDRLAVLPQIAELYAALKAEAESALQVKVRAATELDSAYRNKLIEQLGQRFGKSIELEVEIDSALLGGAVIEAGDLVIDGSLKSKIQRLGDTLGNETGNG